MFNILYSQDRISQRFLWLLRPKILDFAAFFFLCKFAMRLAFPWAQNQEILGRLIIWSNLSFSCLCSLSYCRITPQGCFTLASQLLPRLPHLKVLDLSENSLRQTGIQSLATHLKNPECKLETLRWVCLVVTVNDGQTMETTTWATEVHEWLC